MFNHIPADRSAPALLRFTQCTAFQEHRDNFNP